MSATDKQTAAERAEARRRKILAKKQARMAYVAGDRSKLPSATPSEPILVADGDRTMEAVAAVGPVQAADEVSVRGIEGGDGYNGERMERELMEMMREFRRGGTGEHTVVRKTGLEIGNWVRVLVLGIVAVLCVWWNIWDGSEEWRLSGMYVFASLETCMLMAGGIGGTTAGNGMEMNGMMGLLMRATGWMRIARRVWEDFAVFMVCFLGALYVVTLVWRQ